MTENETTIDQTLKDAHVSNSISSYDFNNELNTLTAWYDMRRIILLTIKHVKPRTFLSFKTVLISTIHLNAQLFVKV